MNDWRPAAIGGPFIFREVIVNRSTIVIVALAAVSTAAVAQVGTDPVDNKIPANQLAADPTPPTATATPPSTDDAPPSDRADAPAYATPTSGDPTGASAPPPKH